MIKVIHEDDELLVVDKPPGVATMGVPLGKPCIWPDILRHLDVGTGSVPFAATQGRLDFHVAGILVIAKNPSTADKLRHAQANDAFQKKYAAIVAGTPAPRRQTLRHWLVKSPRRRRVTVVSHQHKHESAQLAVLDFQVQREGSNWSELEIQLGTGRKHQIRAQLSAIGHPIHGDIKYGSQESYSAGIALVCREVSLNLPNVGCEQWQTLHVLHVPPS